MLLKGEVHQPCAITNVNHSIHVTNGMNVTSPSASLQHKTRADIDRVCQIALN